MSKSIAQKLSGARKRAREISAEIDEGLLKMSAGIDRLIGDRAELLAACEVALDDEDRGFTLRPATADLLRDVVAKARAG